jgi:hypothetical protein
MEGLGNLTLKKINVKDALNKTPEAVCAKIVSPANFGSFHFIFSIAFLF